MAIEDERVEREDSLDRIVLREELTKLNVVEIIERLARADKPRRWDIHRKCVDRVHWEILENDF
jgi:hypothetical protein